MSFAVLEITDGTTVVPLVHADPNQTGFHLEGWRPQVAGLKGGGTWSDSPLGDGRRMVMRRWANAIETFELKVNGFNQDAVIHDTQKLRRLLEQARDYWAPRSTSAPVYIRAQASCETNPRYAVIHDYRTPSDDDPFGSGFSGPLPMMGAWQLVLERGHWLSSPPGEGTCVQTSAEVDGYTYGSNLVANGSFETAGGGGADVFASWTESAGDGTISRISSLPNAFAGTWLARLIAGASANTYIQQNVAVTALATYHFSFWFQGNNAGRLQVLNITSGGDIIPVRNITASPSTWSVDGETITIPAGCNQIGIRFWCNTTQSQAVYFDYVTLRLLTQATFGRSATCAAEVVLANKSSKAQLTDAFYYDASAGTYSSNLIGAALPVALLPAAPAVGDILYLGIDAGSALPGIFHSVVFDINPGVQGTYAVEQWNGSAWATRSLIDHPLNGPGVQTLQFWQDVIVPIGVNGVQGWWIRLRLTAITAGGAAPQQQNRQIYTATRPQALVESAPGGDINALATHTLTGSMTAYNLLLFTRSVARGSRFDPYINFTDWQQEAEISFFFTADSSWVTNAAAATGRCLQFDPPTAMNSVARVTVAAPLAGHYYGEFRLFVKVYQDGGNDGDFQVTLTVSSTSASASRSVTVAAEGVIQMLDFGKYFIPSVPLDGAEIASIEFNLGLANTNAGSPGSLRLLSLVLVPVDECAVEARAGSVYGGDDGYSLLDSIQPKTMIKAFAFDNLDQAVFEGGIQTIATGPLVFAPGGDQYAGVVTLNEPNLPENLVIDQATASGRYLSMRGQQ